MAKLTKSDVLKIKGAIKITEAKELATIYGVSSTTIYDIKSGKTWSHVNPLEEAHVNI